jgi:hypothetical protein
MEGKAWNARPMPSSQAAARTAQQPGLILAAAWVGGKLGGCHGASMGVTGLALRSLAAGVGSPMVEKDVCGAMTRQGMRGVGSN